MRTKVTNNIKNRLGTTINKQQKSNTFKLAMVKVTKNNKSSNIKSDDPKSPLKKPGVHGVA